MYTLRWYGLSSWMVVFSPWVILSVCVYPCVCVCVRERERERETDKEELGIWEGKDFSPVDMTQLLQLCVPAAAAARWTDPKWGGGATAAASCRGFRIVTIVACNNNIQWKRREEKCSRRRRGGGLECWRIHHAATRRDVVLLPSIRAQLEKPLSMELTPITLEAQFDQILETGSPVVIDWSHSPDSKCM